MDWTKKTFKQLAKEKKKKRNKAASSQARKRVGPPIKVERLGEITRGYKR